MFDIFKEDQAEKKFCPPMGYQLGKPTCDLIDWEHFDNKEDANLDGTATVVIGYWKRFVEEVRPHFVLYYVLNTKGKQHMYIQHHPEKGFDILFFQTELDMDFNPIPDIRDQIKGCIKVEGFYREEFTDDTRTSKKTLEGIHDHLSLPLERKLKVYSANFVPGKEPVVKLPKKRKTTKKKKKE